MEENRHPEERVVFRRAAEGDCADLADLSTQLGYPSSPEEMAGRFRRLSGREDCALLVAEVGPDGARRVVAWTQVVRRETLESEPFAELAGLVVDATQRNRRIGRRLLAEAERWAVGEGLALLRVRSNVIRADAHRFYLGLGYSKIKEQAVFVRDLHAMMGRTRGEGAP